jgi:hypothetical protein
MLCSLLESFHLMGHLAVFADIFGCYKEGITIGI